MDILIVHDPREPKNKCSVTPLRGLPGIRFEPLRANARIDVGRRLWLHPEGDELRPDDRADGILLIDCTWRRMASLARRIDGDPVKRRLPLLVTAFPRRSKLTPDPAGGLASVEALYAATAILGEPRADLLAAYRWAGEFLRANPGLAR